MPQNNTAARPGTSRQETKTEAPTSIPLAVEPEVQIGLEFLASYADVRDWPAAFETFAIEKQLSPSLKHAVKVVITRIKTFGMPSTRSSSKRRSR